MNRSFAHNSHARRAITTRITQLILPLASALILGSCATLPPPTSELTAAQDAVAHAASVDSDQYAGDTIAQARSELSQAQVAMASGRDDDARALAGAATADAELASVTSKAATTRADYAQRRDEIAQLRQRLQMQGEVAQESPLDSAAPTQPAIEVAGNPPVGSSASNKAAVIGALAARLQSLDADSLLSGFAAYERLRARQAVDSQTQSYGRLGDNAARIAERRVAIAEIAARTEATRSEIDRLDRQRSELLVQASRRDAEQARQETERLRLQAQVHVEEVQRLREQADTEAMARQQAEDALSDVGVTEAVKLKAAQDKDAALAKQEAALVAADQKASATTPVVSRPKPKAKVRKAADSSSGKKHKTK